MGGPNLWNYQLVRSSFDFDFCFHFYTEGQKEIIFVAKSLNWILAIIIFTVNIFQMFVQITNYGKRFTTNFTFVVHTTFM